VTSAVSSAVLAFIPSPDRGVWYLGPIPIRAYALCIIAGIIVAVVWGERRLVARGGQPGTVTDVAVYAVPFGLVGGRLYHVATDWRTYFGPGGSPIKALEIWEGGLGIWGAIALGAVGAWIGCRRRGVPLPFFADAVAPGIVVAQAVGRLGNYFNQELYGAPTDLPWGLEIYRRVDPATGLADPLGGIAVDHTPIDVVQPTFLYELILNLVVAAVVVWADRRFRLGHGRAFAVYVAGYTLGRFFIEQMRTDQATRVFGDIRINVVVSAVVFVLAIVYLVVVRKPREELAGPETVDEPATQDVEEPGPDLRKAPRPSGGAVAVAEPATKVAGAEASTTYLEVEQATAYLEREPAAKPTAEPAPEQTTEVIAREKTPSVFAAVEQDTEVLKVPTAAKAAPAAAEPAEVVEPATAEAAEDKAAEAERTAEPVEDERTDEPVEAERTAEPVEAERTAEPVEAQRTAEPAEAQRIAEPAEAERTIEGSEPAAEEAASAGTEPAAEQKAAEPVIAEPVAAEPAEPAAPVAEEVAEPAEPVAEPAAEATEPAEVEDAPEPVAADAVAEEPAEDAKSEPVTTADGETTGNPDDEPDEQDTPAERTERVGAKPGEK
jgi:prolipoprotein diacylglyceryl transferase